MLKMITALLLMVNFSYADRPTSSLGDALSSKQKTFSQKMPKEVVELYSNNIKKLKEAGIHKKALNVGDKAPEVQVNLKGQKVPLSKIYSAGPVVLKFYRGGWCPYCMTELKHYDGMYNDFKDAGAQIVAFSPDTEEMSRKTTSTNELDFDVVSDLNHSIARKFGLVFKEDAKIVDQLKKAGVDLAAFQGNNNNELSMPATYVIGKDGRIAFAFVDADYRVRAEPSQVLEVVKAMKK